MKKLLYIVTLFSMVFCSKDSKTNSEISKEDTASVIPIDSTKTIKTTTESETLNKEETLKMLNNEILSTLKSKDFEKFSHYIHPQKGIQFSMYAHVNPKLDKRFTKEDFLKYAPSTIKFTWGEKDGTGEPLVLSIRKYLEQWVFRKDFTKGEFYFNTFKGSGNSLNNLKDVYPTQYFTENYIPSSEEYGGMDWNCLRFVFEELDGTFYLVAVVNDQWTT